MNWTAKEAALAAEGTVFTDWQGEKIVFDSRLIEIGDVFIALPGSTSDGHDHVLDAFNKGASAAIVSRIPQDLKDTSKLLIVEDTLKALNKLAAFKRNKSKAKFIAVTGSVGKTSTKEMLGLALSAHGKTYTSWKNYNNFLGLPICLASMPDDTEYGIFEIGMDHAGEIAPLSTLLNPDVAIITSVENIHRANFDSIEGIANAKAEIFYGLKPDGVAIINKNSNCHDLLGKAASPFKQTYHLGVDSFISKHEIAEHQTTAQMNILGQLVDLTIDQILGMHQVSNMLTALTCVAALNLDPKKSTNILQHFRLPRGRGMIINITINNKKVTLIDDSYNAGAVSVKAALKNMSYFQGRKIAILGDMMGMGPESIALHQGLKEDIVANNIDKVICFGPLMKDLYDVLPEEKKINCYFTLKELALALPHNIMDGDVLLIKGSFYATNLFGFTQKLIENKLDTFY